MQGVGAKGKRGGLISSGDHRDDRREGGEGLGYW